MLSLNQDQWLAVSGGLWCTYEGKSCSDCANMIEIEGNDCSIIKDHLQVRTGKFDSSGLVMSAFATWASAFAGAGIAYTFGLGPAGAVGVGIGLGIAIGIAYATIR